MDAINIPTEWRRFSYLINLRPMEALKQCYDTISLSKTSRAITITFKQEMRDDHEEGYLRDCILKGMSIIGIKRYILYPDIDNNGNFHYHGIIECPKIMIPKIKRMFNRWYGWTKIEYLSDINGWYQYMRKSNGYKSRNKTVTEEIPETYISRHCVYYEDCIEQNILSYYINSLE